MHSGFSKLALGLHNDVLETHSEVSKCTKLKLHTDVAEKCLGCAEMCWKNTTLHRILKKHTGICSRDPWGGTEILQKTHTLVYHIEVKIDLNNQ